MVVKSKSKSGSLGKTETTPQKILASARSLFVERGFAGTSMGQIAAKAGVNHSLLFHHFGNKKNLWLEVKQLIIEEGRAITPTLPSIDLSLENFLHELMSQSIVFYRNNPDIVRMINWQRLDISKDQTIGLNVTQESKRWLDACIYYQKRGEIEASLKPEYIITMILAVVSSAALDPNAFIQSPENNKEYIEFCAKALHKAIRPNP